MSAPRGSRAGDASVPRTGSQLVHVDHSVRVRRPFDAVAAYLVDGPAAWFPRLKPGNVAQVGLHVAGVPVRKRVRVDFGEPASTSTGAVVPVSWKATFAERLFPAMTGNVSASRAARDETRLTVTGMYEPPLGKLGEDLNASLMRRVAKATVKELAEQVAERLERSGRR